MGYLRDNARLEVALNSVILDPWDPQLSTFKFNYIHGRKPLDFNDQAIETIQSNLNTGGLLFVDAACGGFEQWKAFDESFRKMSRSSTPGRSSSSFTNTTRTRKRTLSFKLARESGINIRIGEVPSRDPRTGRGQRRRCEPIPSCWKASRWMAAGW